MVCPICHQETSEIKNNNYYCPNCKIILDTANPQNKEVTPVPNWKMTTGGNFSSSLEKITVPDKPAADSASFIKRYVIVGFSAVFLFSLYMLSSSIGSYIDLGRFCKIKVDGSSHG